MFAAFNTSSSGLDVCSSRMKVTTGEVDLCALGNSRIWICNGKAVSSITAASSPPSELGHHFFLQNSLLSRYSSADDLASICRVFADISHPDVVSWTSLVRALVRTGHDEDALVAFLSMDMPLNTLTLVNVLPVCARLGELRFGRTIHGFARHGTRNVILNDAILDFYMRCGDLLSACNLFDKMPLRDVVSWMTLISDCNDNSLPEEAISAFCVMLKDGIS